MPARFFREKENKDKQKAYYPFGAGPRLCIGNNFAMAEMTIFLREMIQNFDVFPTSAAPRVKPLVTLRPDAVVLAVKKLGTP